MKYLWIFTKEIFMDFHLLCQTREDIMVFIFSFGTCGVHLLLSLTLVDKFVLHLLCWSSLDFKCATTAVFKFQCFCSLLHSSRLSYHLVSVIYFFHSMIGDEHPVILCCHPDCGVLTIMYAGLIY